MKITISIKVSHRTEYERTGNAHRMQHGAYGKSEVEDGIEQGMLFDAMEKQQRMRFGIYIKGLKLQ